MPGSVVGDASILPICATSLLESYASSEDLGIFSVYIHLALWLLSWIFFRNHEDPTWKTDWLICLAFTLGPQVLSIWRHLFPYFFYLVPVTITFTALVLLISLARGARRSEKASWHTVNAEEPLILPCRTSHSRTFPKKHGFSYSYLQVSVPVGFEGRSRSMLSVGTSVKKAWFHIQATDYLNRSSLDQTLKEKLSVYLESQVRTRRLKAQPVTH
jgi:hypothetical protein